MDSLSSKLETAVPKFFRGRPECAQADLFPTNQSPKNAKAIGTVHSMRNKFCQSPVGWEWRADQCRKLQEHNSCIGERINYCIIMPDLVQGFKEDTLLRCTRWEHYFIDKFPMRCMPHVYISYAIQENEWRDEINWKSQVKAIKPYSGTSGNNFEIQGIG